MNSSKLYLFDFDGTLIDSHEAMVYIFTESYASVGIKVDPSYIWRLMRIPLEAGYNELNAPKDKTDIFAKTLISCLNNKKTLSLTKIYPDTLDLLNRLKKENKLIGIVTSNSREHVLDVLDSIGIDPSIFNIIIGNGETSKHKPDPEPVLTAISKMNMNKEEVIYIGDALDDMTCAKNAGVKHILLDRMNEYSNINCDIIHSLNEVE